MANIPGTYHDQSWQAYLVPPYIDCQLIIDNQYFKKPGLSAENPLDLMERLLRELCVGVKTVQPHILMKVK